MKPRKNLDLETLEKRKRRWRTTLLIIALIILGIVGWQAVRQHFEVQEKELRKTIRETVEGAFPGEAEKAKAAFGLEPFMPDGSSASEKRTEDKTIVLIHGLDDPGKVWMNLGPALAENGFHVWILNYPNDQPVSESALFFMKELSALTEKSGVRNISIVAHSMGGLVSREMLTNPDLHYIEKAGKGELPRVERLIMVGTPNHGSEFARFRIFAEFRDQLIKMKSRDYHWLLPIVDGAGEAGIDLTPGSRFLKSLNGRPQPAEVKMTIIAGIIGAKDVQRNMESIDEAVKDEENGLKQKLEDWLRRMSNGVGDGLVTVDSTRLDGVPHYIVDGTHLSIIRNISSESERIPPAVPLIVDVLSGAAERSQVKAD